MTILSVIQKNTHHVHYQQTGQQCWSQASITEPNQLLTSLLVFYRPASSAFQYNNAIMWQIVWLQTGSAKRCRKLMLLLSLRRMCRVGFLSILAGEQLLRV